MEEDPIQRPADFLFPESTLDALTKPKMMFQRIQKRDGTIVDFDKTKIGSAIFKAAQSVGGKDREMSENLGDRVILYLARTYPDGLLNVEIIQDAVEKILIENGHARTVKAYILYRDQRARVRRIKSGKTPIKSEFSITNISVQPSQGLQVQTSEDELVNWNRERIVEALVLETGMAKETAQLIASEVELQIIYSKMQLVTVGLIRELVNAKLIEYGLIQEHRMHARLGLPVYDIEQLLLVNPGMVLADSAIAKDIYRQYAITRVYSNEVVNAHARGQFHLHDLDSIPKLVRGTIPLEYYIKNGVHLPLTKIYSKPATDLSGLISQVIQLGVTWQNYFTESIQWLDFDKHLLQFLNNAPTVEIEDQTHLLLSELAGLGNSVTHEFHFTFPKDSTTKSIALFKSFMTRYNLGDDLGRSYRNILPVIYIHGELLESREFEIVSSLISESQKEKRKFKVFFSRDKSLEQTYTLHKVTLNIVDTALHSEHELEKFYSMIQEQIQLGVEAHSQKNKFIDHLFSNGKRSILYPLIEPYKESMQEKNRISRFVFGITGLEQVVDLLSPSPNLTLEKRVELGTTILEKISDLIQQENWKSGLVCQLEPTNEKEITQRLGKLTNVKKSPVSWTPGIDFTHTTIPWKGYGELYSYIQQNGFISPGAMNYSENLMQELLLQTKIPGISS